MALGVVKPRISAGFKTVKSPALAMPKPPSVPKAGRLAATGGRVGGTPGAKAPRIPKPAMPKPFGKGLPSELRRLKANPKEMLRSRPSMGYRVLAHQDGRDAAVSISRAARARSNSAERFWRSDAESRIRGGQRLKALSESGDVQRLVRPFTGLGSAGISPRTLSGRPRSKFAKAVAKIPKGPSARRRNIRRIQGGITSFAREMDPKRNVSAKFFTRHNVAQIGDGAAALAAQRGATYQRDLIQGVRGLFGKGLPRELKAISRVKDPVWNLTESQQRLVGNQKVATRLAGHQIGRANVAYDTSANYGTTKRLRWDRDAARSPKRLYVNGEFQGTKLDRATLRRESRQGTLRYRATKVKEARGRFLP